MDSIQKVLQNFRKKIVVFLKEIFLLRQLNASKRESLFIFSLQNFLSTDIRLISRRELGEHGRRESGAAHPWKHLSFRRTFVAFTRSDCLFDGSPVGKDASDAKMVTRKMRLIVATRHL